MFTLIALIGFFSQVFILAMAAQLITKSYSFLRNLLMLDLLSKFKLFLFGKSKFLKIFDLTIEDPKVPLPPISKTFLMLFN